MELLLRMEKELVLFSRGCKYHVRSVDHGFKAKAVAHFVAKKKNRSRGDDRERERRKIGEKDVEAKLQIPISLCRLLRRRRRCCCERHRCCSASRKRKRENRF